MKTTGHPRSHALRLAGLLACTLATLSACRKPAPGEAVQDSVLQQDSASGGNPALTRALSRSSDALTEAPSQDSTSPRLSIALIDSSLQAYDGGDTLRDTVLGTVECTGEELREIVLANGLRLSGSTYNLYALEWTFAGNFSPILGLKPGMDSAEVIRLLGRPRSRTANALRYLSAPPEDREADLFEARWSLDLLFEKGKLKALTFVPSMDDC